MSLYRNIKAHNMQIFPVKGKFLKIILKIQHLKAVLLQIILKYKDTCGLQKSVVTPGNFPSFKRSGIGRGRGPFPPMDHSASSELCLPPLVHSLQTAEAGVKLKNAKKPLCPEAVSPCPPWSRCRGWAGARRSAGSAAASGWEGTWRNRSACPCPCHSDTLGQQGQTTPTATLALGCLFTLEPPRSPGGAWERGRMGHAVYLL